MSLSDDLKVEETPSKLPDYIKHHFLSYAIILEISYIQDRQLSFEKIGKFEWENKCWFKIQSDHFVEIILEIIKSWTNISSKPVT